MRWDKERELEEYEKKYLEKQNISSKKDSSGKGAIWKNKNVDLEKLAQKIEDFFHADGFTEVRQEESDDKNQYVVQAKKAGVLRTLTSTRKVLTVVIDGTPNDFHVKVGTGEWGKGIAVSVALTGVVGLVGLGFNAAFREKVWTTIKSIVMSLENTASDSSNTTSESKDEVQESKKPSSRKSAKKKEASEFCENCGNPMKLNVKFCRKCGTKQSDNQE